ncbi:hypothetical protein [Adlercreutzia caecimuris]|uniref:Nucleotidyl transferase AbiEii/AbiGii toxin family protein n=1 Tax=Adlercreutzia caecimuris TaxID=671266 RepID=A0A4S4FZW3_9ACTN|nr:hypothetical protein [Adlercreutzia caecimuris]THG36008.1 hypothetical protein E5986_10440 [Adlercreutzia caecimuris]
MITGARRIKDLIRNRAKGDGATAQMLLRHYAMERLLERLSVSDYRDDFVIKGGMLVPLDRSDEMIDLLAQSEMMEGHWSRYQAANAFAESVSWQDALASLRALASAVKDAKTAD